MASISDQNVERYEPLIAFAKRLTYITFDERSYEHYCQVRNGSHEFP